MKIKFSERGYYQIKKHTAAVIIPSVCLLASIVLAAFFIAMNLVKFPAENFAIWIKVTIPVNLLLVFACVAVVSSIVIGIFSKNVIKIISAAGISISIIMFIATIISIYRRHGGNLSIQAASSNFWGIVFRFAACLAIVSTVVFTVSLFIKRNRKDYKN